MQWKSITTGLGQPVISLWNNGQRMFTLAYNRRAGKLYTESGDGEKRVFHYRNIGILKKKLVLENEYGARLGILKKENGQDFIELEDQKFYLNYSGSSIEVATTDATTQEPLAVYQLEPEHQPNKNDSSLLMVLCLYLQQLAGFHHPKTQLT